MGKEACRFCKIIEERKYTLFESEKVVAILAPNPCTIGHIIVMPKEHFPIIEQVPDPIIAEISSISNKMSTLVFEELGMQGTNILVQNGVAAGQKNAHFMVHVIPRRQDDGLDLQWQPRQVSEEEMSAVESNLKAEAQGIGVFDEKKTVTAKETPSDVEKISDEENYLLKQLRRIP